MSLFLALAAAAAAKVDKPAPTPHASAQATAMVRVVQGTEVRFAEVEKHDPASLRVSRVQASDGSQQSIRIVEFK